MLSNTGRVVRSTHYGWLGDDGVVLRWTDYPPTYHEYVVKRTPRQVKPKLDLSQFERAPF